MLLCTSFKVSEISSSLFWTKKNEVYEQKDCYDGVNDDEFQKVPYVSSRKKNWPLFRYMCFAGFSFACAETLIINHKTQNVSARDIRNISYK